MKKFARLICMLLSISMVVGMLAACGGGKKTYDNEKTVFTTCVGEPDSVFSPFFSTSAYDSEIWGMTQISMLSTDQEGKVYVGEDEPTMAVDYNQRIIIDGNEVAEEDVEAVTANLTEAQKEDGNFYYTEYEFLIKNGVKDSTGTELTIKDVLFNMYVYLDPMYTGSSTMYSTDIKGLNDYRLQTPDVDDDEAEQIEASFAVAARARRSHIAAYFSDDEEVRTTYRNSVSSEVEQEIMEDVIYARQLFWQELNDDWANSVSYVSDTNEHGFTKEEAWKSFLVNYGVIPVTRETDGTIAVFEDGDMEVEDSDGYYQVGDKKIFSMDCEPWYHDKENLIKIVFNSMVGVLPYDEQGDPVASAKNEPKVDIKYDNTFKPTGNVYDQNALIEAIKSSDALNRNMAAIVTYYASAEKMNTYWVADEKQKYFEENDEDSGAPKSISGVTVEKLTAGTTYNGKMGSTLITEDQYVLKIAINAVDPKAIWNFGFTVAPMHYYSNPAAHGLSNKYSGQGYTYFNYPGVDGYDASKEINLGFDNFNQQYLTEVVQAVNKLPVGAGVYMASDIYGKESGIKDTDFFSNNVIYYVRNPYFETTGKQMSNALIKYVQYKVIATTAILNSLENGEIHYGNPNAKTEIVNQVNQNKKFAAYLPKTNGYGYIGINASKIKDLNVRKAIMTAMDTSLIRSYYGDMAEIIYRPMSTNSWAYPIGAKDAYPFTSLPDNADQKARIEDAKERVQSYLDQSTAELKRGSDGKRRMWDKDQNKWVPLKYTFTIAGAETDHPAFKTFETAAEILNSLGFQITVLPDAMALSKLAAGTLEVWAAAWGSSIDPDMYQIYHKDSTATSVNNWGYKYLLSGDSQHVTTELQTLEVLAKEIENGRSSLDQDIRKEYYKKALDYVMELAVEYPTYQRKDLYVINKTVIDINTINTEPTPYSGVLSRMWEVSFITK